MEKLWKNVGNTSHKLTHFDGNFVKISRQFLREFAKNCKEMFKKNCRETRNFGNICGVIENLSRGSSKPYSALSFRHLYRKSRGTKNKILNFYKKTFGTVKRATHYSQTIMTPRRNKSPPDTICEQWRNKDAMTK